MYRWWTFSAGRENRRENRPGWSIAWLKLGPVSFTWGAWFGPRVSFEVHVLNRLVFHHWSTV